MAAAGGSDVVMLMVTGVAVVIMTLRIMARAYRLKQEEPKQQAAPKVTLPKDRQSATSGRGRSVAGEGV